ncbi:ornithine carbamoyltransferase [Halobaculum sp. MBLA0147]|uniref:ornithine carbamoyltransferase n=1 Tax=Halobaculum sp. MBLA0147 TaxID=3079934 RepID=UPI0035260B33
MTALTPDDTTPPGSTHEEQDEASGPHDATNPTHFTHVDDLSAGTVERLLDRAAVRAEDPSDSPLSERTVALLFEKPSTRTRVSFETGLTRLGGHAQFLGPDDLQLGAGEPLRDTARALSGYVDGIVARLFDHEDLETLAEYATVPVVNGLTDAAHPCQTLADLRTLQQTVGLDAAVTWVGDANNVARSLAVGCALLGVDLTLTTPAAHGFDEGFLDRLPSVADGGPTPTVTSDPESAVAGADAVYTDVWISMGEDAAGDKRAAFETGGFQLDADLLSLAADDAVCLHCLPAHRGEEITDAVLEGPQSVVWTQAENRLYTQEALVEHLVASKE